MKNGKILVGITHGDINGVGYEIILKLFSEPMMLELCTPIIYGSPKVATYHRKAMELTTNFVTIQKADEAVEGALESGGLFDGRGEDRFRTAFGRERQGGFGCFGKGYGGLSRGAVRRIGDGAYQQGDDSGRRFPFPRTYGIYTGARRGRPGGTDDFDE